MRNYLKSFATRETLGQFVRMGLIGVFNTVTYFVLFNVCYLAFGELGLGTRWNSFWSVTVAFGLATALSYVLNRRWAFRIRGGWGSLGESGGFLVVNLISWGITQAVTQAALLIFPDLGQLGLNAANLVATAIIIIPKFAAYRDLVFKRSLARSQ